MVLVLSRGGFCPKERLQDEGLVGLNKRKSEVHHAELRRDYHWHRTVRAGLGAAIGGCRPEGRDHRT